MRVDITDNGIAVDASLLGELLRLPSAEIPALLRTRAITSMCERGIGTDAGCFRLNFFYRNLHARLRVDTSGHILHRSVVDFGDADPRRARQRPKLDRAGGA